MKECAFCNHVGSLSAEHTVSQWIADFFPGKTTSWFSSKSASREFTRKSVDWKAREVCVSCNNNWMSDIESEEKPILTPLITGESGTPIGPLEARSIAHFVFVKAVVLDHAHKAEGTRPFFNRHDRFAFREHRTIPSDVHIWICGYKDHRTGGSVRTLYHQSNLPSGERFKMYVCTCAFGYFAFQLLAVKYMGNTRFWSTAGFEPLAIPIWPGVQPDFVWPPHYARADREQFCEFSNRWARIRIGI